MILKIRLKFDLKTLSAPRLTKRREHYFRPPRVPIFFIFIFIENESHM